MQSYSWPEAAKHVGMVRHDGGVKEEMGKASMQIYRWFEPNNKACPQAILLLVNAQEQGMPPCTGIGVSRESCS